MKNYSLYQSDLNITSFRQLVEMHQKTHPDGAAFRFRRKKEIIDISFAQFKREIFELGAFFRSLGLQNAKIAVVGENSYEWILTYFAAVMSENIIVPIDKELPDKDICTLLEISGADILVYSAAYSAAAEQALRNNQVHKTFSMEQFPALLEKGGSIPSLAEGEFSSDENAVCAIIYTSGTTGTPKGVMLSQRNLIVDAVASAQNVCVTGASLLTLPLHHTFAFTAAVLAELIYGFPICINSSLRTFTSDMQLFKPQNMFLVPLYVETMYKTIWKTAQKQNKDRLLKRMIHFSNFTRKFGLDLRRKLFAAVLKEFGGNLDLVISGGAALGQQYADGMTELGMKDFGISLESVYNGSLPPLPLQTFWKNVAAWQEQKGGIVP